MSVLKSTVAGKVVGEVVVAFRGTESATARVFVEDWATNLSASTLTPKALTGRDDHDVKAWKVRAPCQWCTMCHCHLSGQHCGFYKSIYHRLLWRRHLFTKPVSRL